MKKLITLLRVAASVALVIGWYKGMQALVDFHYACCPELYTAPASLPLMLLPLLGIILVLPFLATAIAAASGYRLHRAQWFFLEITKPDKLRFRPTKKLGWTFRMLPPRTDGTSPYVLYWFSVYICFAALFVLFAVLAVIFWRMPAARYLNNYALSIGLWVVLMPMLPTRTNALDRVLTFRKSRDLRRAWECNLHMTAAIEQKTRLQDMPEEWFLPYPAELADYPLVRAANFNRASRLINQKHYREGYDILRYFFDLKPSPETNGMIACAILNGVICEALADLPPMCLSQLDHPTLKLPLPPGWETQRLQAEYARALFLHHDEAEAAEILPRLEAAFDKDGRTSEGIEALQRKAGLLPAEED